MALTARAIATIAAIGLSLALTPMAGADPAPGEPGFGVRFNQHLIEEIKRSPSVEVDDVVATFRHVFAALPDTAHVYPTENYYYFTFFHEGVEYAGNLRLDTADRDDGVLHFAYYPQNTPWSGETKTRYRALTSADGVGVTRVGELAYDVTFEQRSVRFVLNDLSDIVPPGEAVRESERYLGPVFDESGIAFYLLFDEERRDFLFVLDDRDRPLDTFFPVHEDHPALTIGQRTGFAFYRDRFAPRRILVGVHLQSVILNDYLDGPFDQLPDNFIEGNSLYDAIVTKHPDLEGEIDRFGGFRAHHGRFLVTPYVNYSHVEELEQFLRCGDADLDEARFYACIMPEETP